MSLHVACIDCHQTFPAETHAGLVRCAPCQDRTGWRLPTTGTAAHVVEFDAAAWA